MKSKKELLKKSKIEIFELEKTLLQLENLHASFDYIRISLASPERMRNWSSRKLLPSGLISGEVLQAETINFRTHEPEAFGLFCETIFGPTTDWQCKCGEYKGFILEKICEFCDVELIDSRVRRYRMGFIELSCPITHFWYLKGIPNYLLLLLQVFDKKKEVQRHVNVEDLESIVYLTPLEDDLDNPLNRWIQIKRKPSEMIDYLLHPWNFRRYGSEILKVALENLDENLEEHIKKLRIYLTLKLSRYNYHRPPAPYKSMIRRIRILESFLATKTKPSWMILTVLPILPPTLRPLLHLEDSRLMTSDLNEFYRVIINRNQRLYDFLHSSYMGPDMLTVHGRKLLQEAIDGLIDNSRIVKPKRFSFNNRELKSLTEILEGKEGRFRQSLLGKRVDYSARSVIIVGPDLRLNQCGLPYDIAVELFEPFLIHELLMTLIEPPDHNITLANLMIQKNKPFIWTLLIRLTLKHSILLNRAPTLHRFGIQAFDPILIFGQAIHLHPLVCTGFNADFDGDQMAVHLPLYESSQLEIQTLMRPSYNVLSPSNGEVILKPTQDMVIGSYYLTLMFDGRKMQGKPWFGSEQEAISALFQKKITLHTPIFVRYLNSTFEIKIENQKFFFLDKQTNLKTKEIEIVIYQILKQGKILKKLFLLTNFGIFIVNQIGFKTYQFQELFLETTVGRVIFSKNLKLFLKDNYVYNTCN
jgi:DNA-directed RNA polymerase subunit beta'